jgi:uroporphyrinogen III methyltransferase/synthase
MPNQQVVSGTLADIVDRVRAVDLKPPAVTIVGQVAGLRQQLHWFEDRPLFGQRVLVTRTRQQASALSARLRALGAEAIELPTISISPPDDRTPLDRAIAEVSHYDWIIFTSVNGVGQFWEQLACAGLDARALYGVQLAAIGPATAARLGEYGLRADYMPDEYVAEAIAAGLGDVRGQRVLLPRADIARPALADLLRQNGATIVEVAAYRTLRPRMDADKLSRLLARVTVATFTSSSTVSNLAAMAQDAGLELPQALAQATIACIGPITAATARELGLQVTVVAKAYTIEGLVEALLGHLRDS